MVFILFPRKKSVKYNWVIYFPICEVRIFHKLSRHVIDLWLPEWHFFFFWSFWIRLVFLFVIHSGILDSSKHLLTCRVNLSRMGWIFKTRIHISHHVLVFSDFVLSWVLLLVSPGNSFSCYLSISVMLFIFQYLTRKNMYNLHSDVGLSLCILHRLDGRIFFTLFWKVLFCLYFLLYLLSLSSFTKIFWSCNLSILVVLSDLSSIVFFFFSYFCVFLLSSFFCLFSQFLYLFLLPHFLSRFCIFVQVSWRIRILSLSNYVPA